MSRQRRSTIYSDTPIFEGASELAIQKETKQKDIWYISDLHFDVLDLDDVLEEGKYNSKLQKARLREKNFLDFVSKLKKEKVFILAGDFWENFNYTIDFFKKLEQLEIESYFVLGNHDYWNDGKYTYEEIEQKVIQKTKNNMFAHFLCTRTIFHYGGFAIIGDTGFTNFEYNTDEIRDAKTGQLIKHKHTAIREDFFHNDLDKEVPDISMVKSWNINNIRKRHKDWIDFANSIIETNTHTIVVTHFPMSFNPPEPIDIPESEKAFSTWWNCETNLKISDKNWYIFGHTHKPWEYHNGTVLAQQSGYKRKSTFSEINDDWFGKLHFYLDGSELSSPTYTLAKFQNFSVVKDPQKEASLIKEIQRNGYRRAGNSENKRVISEYINTPSMYIKNVRRNIKKESKIVNGYLDNKAYLINQNIKAVEDSLEILEKGYEQSNLFDFFTALIVTGYAYSNMISFLDYMRPVNSYDVARYAMLFVTLEYYSGKVDLNNIESVRRSNKKNSYVTIGNVPLWLPSVNGYELSLENYLPFQDTFNAILAENRSEERLKLEYSPPTSVEMFSTDVQSDNYIEQYYIDKIIKREKQEKEFVIKKNELKKLKKEIILKAEQLKSENTNSEIIRSMYGLNTIGFRGFKSLYQESTDFTEYKEKMEEYAIEDVLEEIIVSLEYKDNLYSLDYMNKSKGYLPKTKKEIAEDEREIEQRRKEEDKRNEDFYSVHPNFKNIGIKYNIERQEVNALLFKYSEEHTSFIKFQSTMKSYSREELLERLHAVIE